MDMAVAAAPAAVNVRPDVINIDGLRKVYRVGQEKVVALDYIDLAVPKGEICCLLGTSGSGKSTLLNMLAGLEKPTKGKILVNGADIVAMSEQKLAVFRQKNTGFVFQSYNLITSLTAVENVGLPLLFMGVKKKQRDKLAKKILDLVGLSTHYKHRPSQMSGGQQQRVAIARAFVAQPDIVFADEPTGNLDTKTTIEVMEMMVGMARRHDQTLVIVTHDVEISAYADRIIHITDGRIDSIKTNEHKQTVCSGDADSSAPI